MKVAIATKDFGEVSGHAGKAQQWLVYDLAGHRPGGPLPEPARVTLTKEQTPHYIEDDTAPHPLDGVEVMIAGSAGDGFVRHMKKRGADVVLTGEPDPAAALTKLIAGEDLPDQKFDITTSLCKLRDFFSRH
jgi:predicted Fe-Mo cluster-binding NifX family protein